MNFDLHEHKVPRSLRGKRTLVTGANGFVGANLVHRLVRAGIETHVLLRPTSDLCRLASVRDLMVAHRGSIEDAEAVARAIRRSTPDAIIHLSTARGTGTAEAVFVQTSVMGAQNLIDGIRSSGGHCTLVVAGSSLEYSPCDHAIPESWPLQPTTIHGAAKAAASILFSQAACTGLAITQLRLFHVYGPWESAYRFLPTAIRLAAQGKPVPLATGASRRDWVYVEDVIDAILLAVSGERPCGIYNIGNGVEHENDTVIALLADAMGIEISVLPGLIADRPSDQPHRFANITCAREDLGWKPRHDLEHGIRQALRWFEGNQDIWMTPQGLAPVVK